MHAKVKQTNILLLHKQLIKISSPQKNINRKYATQFCKSTKVKYIITRYDAWKKQYAG
jgi:hypothetical protein